MSDSHWDEYLSAYLSAKTVLYRGAEGFESSSIRGVARLHRVPGWPEVDAFYAYGLEAPTVIEAVRSVGCHERHAVTIFSPSLHTPQGYEELGYTAFLSRLDGIPQPLMAFRVSGDCVQAADVCVQRVETPEQLEFLNRGETRVRLAAFDSDQFKRYFIERDGVPVNWGTAVVGQTGVEYITGVETHPAYRRRGFAAALMRRIHQDAVARGSRACILCASPEGVLLYKAVGYEVVAYMHTFVPAGSDFMRQGQ